MPAEEQDFATSLLAHFDAHRRDLPWRSPGTATRRDPYAVLVSEAMLQQTRVRTAASYFERWMARFPGVGALAAASRDDVLRAWEGLGYYRRAHALHQAAQVVMERHGGRVPDDPEALRALPGIGPYSAAAIAAFAYDRAVVAVDANVRRVACRLAGHRSAPKDTVLAAGLAARAPARRHGDYAEALVELGATVCTARAPACAVCPMTRWCAAKDRGPERFPATAAKAPPPTRRRYAWLVQQADSVLLERRARGMLAGLWGFPQRDAPPTDGTTPATHEPTPPTHGTTAPVGVARPIAEVRHAYSHYRLALTLCVAEAACADVGRGDEHVAERRFVPWTTLPELAMSVVDRKVVAALVRSGHAPAAAVAPTGGP